MCWSTYPIEYYNCVCEYISAYYEYFSQVQSVWMDHWLTFSQVILHLKVIFALWSSDICFS